MLADAPGDAGQFRLGSLRIDHDMAESVGKRDEIAFRVDHALLDPWGALFEQTAQKVRLSRARIALHQQAGRKKFL
jgi:hypothetical protein